MQLNPASRESNVRARLGAAVSVLLAAGLPAAAQAEPAPAPAPAASPGASHDATTHTDAGPRWQFEGSTLLYGERNRAGILEPVARITRLLPDGQMLSAQFALDVMTGASPSGAMPSGQVQTTTTPSGNTKTIPPGTLPTNRFQDLRGALDLAWTRPVGSLFSTTTGAHFSREKDYQSLGGNLLFSLDVDHRLMTLTAGGGYNHDRVFPIGGAPPGLTVPVVAPAGGEGGEGEEGGEGGELGAGPGIGKEVRDGMVGISRVLTRRWLVGANLAQTYETGYLTEPYKVVSLIDPTTGFTTGQLTEKRPTSRRRTSVLGNSVYHLKSDVLYLSYRWYRDDWGIRSHTVDLKLRRDLGNGTFFMPHLRAYVQTQADFFHLGLRDGDPLPEYASSDFRLGELRTATLGGTYGFALPGYPGEFTVRAEYIHQWGKSHPADAVGVQRDFDLEPPVEIGSLHLGYTVRF